MSIGERLKDLRITKNLTETELGNKLNIDPFIIMDYEKNTYMPSGKNLIEFSKFFIVTTDYILGLSKNKMNEHDFFYRFSSFTGLSAEQKEFLLDFEDFIDQNNIITENIIG